MTATSCVHLSADSAAPQLMIKQRVATGQPRVHERLCIACGAERAVQLSLSGAKSFNVVAPLDFRSCPHTLGKLQCVDCLSAFKSKLKEARTAILASASPSKEGNQDRHRAARIGNVIERVYKMRSNDRSAA